MPDVLDTPRGLCPDLWEQSLATAVVRVVVMGGAELDVPGRLRVRREAWACYVREAAELAVSEYRGGPAVPEFVL